MASTTPYAAFTRAITKINKCLNSELKIEKAANEFLGQHLYRLTCSIARKAAENATYYTKSRLDYSDVVDVLPDVLLGEVLTFAHREGCRQLTLFSEGMITFKPRNPRSSRAAEEKVIPPIFEGVVRIAKKNILRLDVLPKYDEGGKKVNEWLSNIANFLLRDLVEVVREGNITEVDDTHVSRAVARNLPPKLLEHALHCGYNSLAYQNGRPSFISDASISAAETPRKKRKIVKSSTPKTTRKRVSSANKTKPRKAAETRRKNRKIVKSSTPKTTRKRASKTEPRKAAEKTTKTKSGPKSKPVQKMKSVKKSKKSSAEANKLDLSEGIQKLFETTKQQLGPQIDHSGLQRINTYMTSISDQLIQGFASQNSPISCEAIITEINKWFPAEIAKHVIAHASKCILISAIQDTSISPEEKAVAEGNLRSFSIPFNSTSEVSVPAIPKETSAVAPMEEGPPDVAPKVEQPSHVEPMEEGPPDVAPTVEQPSNGAAMEVEPSGVDPPNVQASSEDVVLNGPETKED